jgi:hypothetical protein
MMLHQTPSVSLLAFSITRPRSVLRLLALLELVADVRRLLRVALMLSAILDLEEIFLILFRAASCGRLLMAARVGGDKVKDRKIRTLA